MKIHFFLLVCYLFPCFMKCDEPFWIRLDEDIFPIYHSGNIPQMYCFAFDRNNNVFVVGDADGYKSTDNGYSWVSLGLKENAWNLIFIDDIGYIFIINGASLIPGIAGDLFRSKDGGISWENITWRVGWGDLSNRAMIMNKRNHLFVGEYRTTDHGDTWTNEYKEMGEYFSYAMNSEGHIFRGGIHGPEAICRSTDDGDTWEVVLSLPYNPDWVKIEKMMFNPKSTIGYAGLKTTDNGRTWYDRNIKIEPAGEPAVLDSMYNFYSFIGSIKDPPIYLYPYRNVMDSSWVPMDTSGLNGVDEFNTIATSPNGYLYLAAHNGGLYRSRQAFVSAPDTPPAEHIGIAIFPNPASDYIEINLGRWTPSVRWSPSDLTIYNSLGKCVLTPLAFGEGPGVRLDISALPPGLYNCIFSTPKFMESVKFIIVR